MDTRGLHESTLASLHLIVADSIVKSEPLAETPTREAAGFEERSISIPRSTTRLGDDTPEIDMTEVLERTPGVRRGSPPTPAGSKTTAFVTDCVASTVKTPPTR